MSFRIPFQGHSVTRIALALSAMFSFSSCALVTLSRNVKEIEQRGVVAVQVSPKPSGSAPTYALAYLKKTGARTEIAGVQKVKSEGLAIFDLLLGNHYGMAAFTDRNGNGHFDAGEPMALAEDVVAVPLADTNARIKKPVVLNLTTRHDFPKGYSLQLPKPNEKLGGSMDVALGEIANLKDEKFSSKSGEMGMWQPFDFLSKNGFGIYFLEPYQPGKIPVLCVYGIAGSPQDFEYFFENFDRSKYQLWFYYYPSGIRLDKAANAMAGGINMLRQQYGFPKMYVVAHSMGGLVSRGGIQRAIAQAGTNFIPKFVSISTPWGGHKAAESGVKHLKNPVPSWRDMMPGSAYVDGIFAKPLPAGTKHYLLFGYQTKESAVMKGDNDTVVYVNSELDYAAQNGAVKMFGFNYSHMQILTKKDTLAKVEEYLAE